MASYRFKRGSTFLLPCICTEDDGTTRRDITNDTITCHVRKSSGDALVVETVVTKTDAAEGEFECLAEDGTAEWALGEHYTDIRYVNAADEIDITETIHFEVVREATRS